MSIIIRSLSASLTRSNEIIGTMVPLSSLRTHTSKYFSEDTNTRLKFARRAARTQFGVTFST
jgi:hypothetical protein